MPPTLMYIYNTYRIAATLLRRIARPLTKLKVVNVGVPNAHAAGLVLLQSLDTEDEARSSDGDESPRYTVCSVSYTRAVIAAREHEQNG